MILGQALLWLTVGCSLGAVAVADARLLRAAAWCATAATAVLAASFLTEDWSLLYVADNTRSGLSWPIRVAGLWAGAEGSLLLWTTMVAWVAVLAVGRKRVPSEEAQDWAVRLGAGLVVGYGLVVALAASPFDRLAVPAIDGLGLQPVLEYPAMIWHPPILYAGLVGLLLPTIGAAAEALAGLRPRITANRIKPPMVLLTIGLMTGAVWANVELGWGGFWAWDPIESAGLVAWLCGAVALHAQSGDRRVLGPSRLVTAVFVAPGIAALWATTLTRIGVVASVHAFADRPALRVGLLIVAALASATLLWAVVATGRTSAPGTGPPSVSRPGGRRSAVGVLATAALFVAVGTYEPLFEAATSGDAVAIAGHYYTRLLWPVVIVGASLVLRADRALWPSLAGAAIAVVTVPAAAGPFALGLAAAGGAVTASACSLLRARRPGALAHIGVGLVLVGVAEPWPPAPPRSRSQPAHRLPLTARRSCIMASS